MSHHHIMHAYASNTTLLYIILNFRIVCHIHLRRTMNLLSFMNLTVKSINSRISKGIPSFFWVICLRKILRKRSELGERRVFGQFFIFLHFHLLESSADHSPRDFPSLQFSVSSVGISFFNCNESNQVKSKILRSKGIEKKNLRQGQIPS